MPPYLSLVSGPHVCCRFVTLKNNCCGLSPRLAAIGAGDTGQRRDMPVVSVVALASTVKAWAAIDIAPDSRLANRFPKGLEKGVFRDSAPQGREDVGIRVRSQRSAKAGELPRFMHPGFK
jgi:hypothetical protein